MATKNDITGDELITKATTNAYADGWDRVFDNKEKTLEDIAQEHPNDKQFVPPTERIKAVNKFDHLIQCLQGQAHIDRPEYVNDVIISVTKFEDHLNDRELDLLHNATKALQEGTTWKTETVEVIEDDGYAD